MSVYSSLMDKQCLPLQVKTLLLEMLCNRLLYLKINWMFMSIWGMGLPFSIVYE